MKSIFCVSMFALLISSTASAQTTAAMCIGPSGLPERATCESGGRANVSLTANRSGAPAAVQCDVTPTELTAGVDERRAIVVQNLGPTPIYICIGVGTVDGCTTATGLKVSNGDALVTLEVGPSVKVYCIAEAKQVSPADTRVAEVR